MDTNWTPYPDVGLAEVDAEHRAIAAALRDLLAAVIDDDRERTVTLGRRLIERAAAHFAHEEAMMREVDYTNAGRHEQLHATFLGDAMAQLDAAGRAGLSAEFLKWVGGLDQWLYRHVMTEDMWLAFAVKRARAALAAADSRH